MHAALDATPLTLSSGGLRRYTLELSLALAREFPEDRFTLLSDQVFEKPSGSPSNLAADYGTPGPVRRRWWTVGATLTMRRIGACVFHGTNFEVPYAGTRPSVLTLHDLSPWKTEPWGAGSARVRHRTPWLLRMGVATMVITPTEAVRGEAMTFFGLAATRVVSVPLAAAANFSPCECHPARPYFLYIGALEARKNIEAIVDAWRIARSRCGADLVLVGRPRPDFGMLEAEPGLCVRGEVTDTELRELYCGALAFVFPSHYEGFGLPVLEAMQCGTPVIASKAAALREVAGDAALFFDGTTDLAEAMAALATNRELARELSERSRRRAAQFSWGRTARLTRGVYQEALARFV